MLTFLTLGYDDFIRQPMFDMFDSTCIFYVNYVRIHKAFATHSGAKTKSEDDGAVRQRSSASEKLTKMLIKK